MPRLVISNAAHTIIRRSIARDHGHWSNGWSERVPGTTFWEVELSQVAVTDILSYQRMNESLSETIVRMFLTYERQRGRKQHAHSSTTSS